jgi:protein phosphatase PTC1
MANTEITDDAELAEKVREEVLQKMGDDGPGPDVPIEATSPNKVQSINGST